MTLDNSSIETHSAESRTFEPSEEFVERARLSLAQYDDLYRESMESPNTFWKRESEDLVFRKPWQKLLDWDLPHSQWFVGAELNASESCLDRHLKTEVRDTPALIWESEPGETRRISYGELHEAVVRLSSVLRGLGVKKGDRVAIYMGMVPEVVIGMLACARIGAPHMVVFGGFAAESLRDRINDCSAKVVLTQDGALRRGSVVPLKATVDKALEAAPSVEKVLVFQRLTDDQVKVDMKPGRDLDWNAAVLAADPKLGAEPEIVDAEHPLFILYTSGSTGKPKGVLHTTAGYLVGTHVTSKYVFDLRPGDVYFCTADVGWITGHSYIVYGPLSNGATCLMYEGAPNQPCLLYTSPSPRD